MRTMQYSQRPKSSVIFKIQNLFLMVANKRSALFMSKKRCTNEKVLAVEQSENTRPPMYRFKCIGRMFTKDKNQYVCVTNCKIYRKIMLGLLGLVVHPFCPWFGVTPDGVLNFWNMSLGGAAGVLYYVLKHWKFTCCKSN